MQLSGSAVDDRCEGRHRVASCFAEGVHRRIGIYCSDSIDPALIENAPKLGVGRHDVEIPREHDRRLEGVKLDRVYQEALHPGELIFEIGPG